MSLTFSRAFLSSSPDGRAKDLPISAQILVHRTVGVFEEVKILVANTTGTNQDVSLGIGNFDNPVLITINNKAGWETVLDTSLGPGVSIYIQGAGAAGDLVYQGYVTRAEYE